jgi:hypothetical protein
MTPARSGLCIGQQDFGQDLRVVGGIDYIAP